MKKASTLISVIIAIVMLLAALGVGFAVKRFRVEHAEKAVLVKAEPKAKVPSGRAALPGGGERRRPVELTDEQKSERQDARAKMNDKVENMSDEQRRQFVSERGDRFGGGDRQGGGRRRSGSGMSDEERQAMRDRYENMSEEEREQAREEMRQRFGGRRRGDRGGAPDGAFMRRGEGGEASEESQDNPPDN